MNRKTARTIIDSAHDYGTGNGLAPLAVVVLDAGGNLVASERADGASIGRMQIAHGKAYGALAMGTGSRALMARAEQQPYFIAAVGTTINGPLIPAPGGVLVSDGSATVGAVGISGAASDDDEAAAVHAVSASGLRADGG